MERRDQYRFAGGVSLLQRLRPPRVRADCWAKLYCSGGCAANAYHASGSIRGIYEAGCELFRKRMECAIMLQAALAEEAEA